MLYVYTITLVYAILMQGFHYLFIKGDRTSLADDQIDRMLKYVISKSNGRKGNLHPKDLGSLISCDLYLTV